VDLFEFNEVVVVEEEDESYVTLRYFVDDGRNKQFGRRRLWRLQDAHYCSAHVGVDGLQGGDEVRPETGWIIVALVERRPGGQSSAAGDPFADRRALAKAGRGGEEGQPATLLRRLGEALDQVRP